MCHTTELPIGGVIRNSDDDRLIVQSLKALVQLGTHIYSTLIKNEGLKGPTKYCATRWHLIHEILDSLVTLKRF